MRANILIAERFSLCVPGVAKDRKAVVGSRNIFRLIFLVLPVASEIGAVCTVEQIDVFPETQFFYVAWKGQRYYHRTCGLTAVF